MTYPDYVVTFRGHPACPCQTRWLPAFEAEAQRRGILTSSLPISQLIGGAPQSGGTHTDGGAADFYPLTNVAKADGFVWLARQMGADATWERPYNWDHAGGVQHVHSVLTGCPHNGPARYQIDAVQAGQNGLASHGPDDGPRPLSGRTWREGIAWARAQAEEQDMTDEQDARLKRVEAAVTALQKREDNRDAHTKKRLQRLIEQGKATKAELEELRAALDG